MTKLIILTGARGAVPDDLLTAHIRHARGGSRLLVVDQRGLASFHADQSRDLVIDPARGNWDIASDCRDEGECLCVAKALIEQGSPLLLQLATLTLTDILLSVVEQPQTDLGQLSATVRAKPFDSIELPSNVSDPQHRLAYTVLAMLNTAAGSFPPRDRRMPLTSLRRWYDPPAGRILYLLAPQGDVIAAGVRRAILALVRGLTVIEPDHAMVEFGSASQRGGELAA